MSLYEQSMQMDFIETLVPTDKVSFRRIYYVKFKLTTGPSNYCHCVRNSLKQATNIKRYLLETYPAIESVWIEERTQRTIDK